mmetsp:Transcript_15955/g.26064  ORF Transcript_15955/g.26064 Transcript_15955/m.26064 type:complete len:221 (-) Transcript_15955:2436-3098(-)
MPTSTKRHGSPFGPLILSVSSSAICSSCRRACFALASALLPSFFCPLGCVNASRLVAVNVARNSFFLVRNALISEISSLLGFLPRGTFGSLVSAFKISSHLICSSADSPFRALTTSILQKKLRPLAPEIALVPLNLILCVIPVRIKHLECTRQIPTSMSDWSQVSRRFLLTLRMVFSLPTRRQSQILYASQATTDGQMHVDQAQFLDNLLLLLRSWTVGW